MAPWHNRIVAGAFVVALLAISGCSYFGGGEEDVPLDQIPPDEIYTTAEAKLEAGDPEEAAELFSEVERLYPYSEWAQRAAIMSAFSYHKARMYEESRATAQRYLDFYPASEDAGYAQYIIALGFYDQIDDVGRDQGLTFQALQALRVAVERYPDSEYTKSALLKFDLALDHLAAKEMEIGRYYLKKGHYAAAINRFRVVVEDFQTTTHTPEALHRLVEAYLSLGLNEDARTAGAILGYNFQSTEWYHDSYVLLTGKGISIEDAQAKGDGWLARIYRRVLRGEWL
jgi:outer membrane protein assembly factor BamD